MLLSKIYNVKQNPYSYEKELECIFTPKVHGLACFVGKKETTVQEFKRCLESDFEGPNYFQTLTAKDTHAYLIEIQENIVNTLLLKRKLNRIFKKTDKLSKSRKIL